MPTPVFPAKSFPVNLTDASNTSLAPSNKAISTICPEWTIARWLVISKKLVLITWVVYTPGGVITLTIPVYVLNSATVGHPRKSTVVVSVCLSYTVGGLTALPIVSYVPVISHSFAAAAILTHAQKVRYKNRQNKQKGKTRT